MDSLYIHIMDDKKTGQTGISSGHSPARAFAPSAAGSLKDTAIKLNGEDKKVLKTIGQKEIPGSEIIALLAPWKCRQVAARMVCLIRKLDQHSPVRPELTEAQLKIMGVVDAALSRKADGIVETLGSKGFGIQSLAFELAAICRKYVELAQQSPSLVALPQSETSSHMDASAPGADKI